MDDNLVNRRSNPAGARRPQAPKRVSTGARRKVLIADDDPLYQCVLRSGLKLWGYDAVTVSDGDSALRALLTPDGPKLAILDWMMPKLHGPEVCRQVRAARPDHYVYIILLSARQEPADVNAGLEAGADDYLVKKPDDLNELRMRLRAGDRVFEWEERNRVIAETASDGIVTFEHDGRLCYANPGAGAIFGYERCELEGMDFGTLIPGFRDQLDASAKENGSDERLSQARSWAPFEVGGRHRTGRELVLEVSVSESMDRYPKRVTTAVIRDVTARQLEAAPQEFRRKLEAVGQLAAGIARELRTAILAAADNMRFVAQSQTAMHRLMDSYRRLYEACENGDSPAPVMSEIDLLTRTSNFQRLRQETPVTIADALEGVQRAGEIAAALEEFSGYSSSARTSNDLNHLIEVALLISRSRWTDLAEIHLNLEELPPVNCMAGELSDVILNLILNAADAVSESLAGSDNTKGKIWISSRRDGRSVEVCVRDSGNGIAEEDRPRVFDPSFTGHRRPGRGQGLADARTIVAGRHNGTIDFETEPGKGTSFVLRLPIEEAKPAELPQVELAPVVLAPVELPTAELTQVELAPVELPPAGLAPVELAQVELGSVELAPVDLSTAELTQVELAPVELAPVELAQVELVPVELPPVELPTAELAQVELASVELPQVELASVELPPVELAPVELAPVVLAPVVLPLPEDLSEDQAMRRYEVA